jgi:hypothetical protein
MLPRGMLPTGPAVRRRVGQRRGLCLQQLVRFLLIGGEDGGGVLGGAI